ncbi:MAG: 50S ribosomal protein L19 [bacterium JZ-2024 1]
MNPQAEAPASNDAYEKYKQIRPGQTVRVYFLSRDGDKAKETAFEGIVIALKHGRQAGATLTVRKESYGVGLEKIFPLHSPLLTRIEIVRQGKVRRAKLYYLRGLRGKKARLKSVRLTGTEPLPEETLEPGGPSES